MVRCEATSPERININSWYWHLQFFLTRDRITVVKCEKCLTMSSVEVRRIELLIWKREHFWIKVDVDYSKRPGATSDANVSCQFNVWLVCSPHSFKISDRYGGTTSQCAQPILHQRLAISTWYSGTPSDVQNGGQFNKWPCQLVDPSHQPKVMVPPDPFRGIRTRKNSEETKRLGRPKIWTRIKDGRSSAKDGALKRSDEENPEGKEAS